MEGMSCRGGAEFFKRYDEDGSATHGHVDRVDAALVLSFAEAEFVQALDDRTGRLGCGIDEVLSWRSVMEHQTPTEGDGGDTRDGGGHGSAESTAATARGSAEIER